MRNLKKILALVLALIMSLSLMATAGAADFPDSEKISNDNYALAADILSDLNVFVGDQNGNFNPDQPITRAEVAAIIYRITTGDVTNEKNNTYTSYGQFDDVISGDWYEGYVTYCAIAGYIKGRSDGNFWPKDQVTGYEVLAMILRAVGYDKNGEFVGKDWQINTARIARENEILKNITNDSAVELSKPVTREVVAEILFQAIQVPQVTWSIISNTYTKDGLTLAKEHLDMESVTGVVMANEWANINANDNGGYAVLADGKTELKPEGEKALTLDVATDLEAVGQTYTAYIQNGTRVLGDTLTCSEKNIVADNEGKSVNVASLDADESHANAKYDEGYETIADLAYANGITSIKDAVYFLDYSEDYTDWDTTDILIRYAVAKTSVDESKDWNQYRIDVDAGKVDGHLKTEIREIPVNWDPQNDGNDANNTVLCYVFAIQPEAEITGTDKEIMQKIFYTADRLGDNVNPNNSTTTQNYVYGEVYVGTSSMTDVSDTMSWTDFQKTYFIPEDTVNYLGCGNGQSLRVIDNNGDGVAEYIFKVQYWQDKAIGEYKDTLEFYDLYPSRNAVWDGGAETYAVGDMVNYRVIDGKTTIWKAEKITAVIDHKNFKDITVTPAEGEALGQSDIWNNTTLSDDIMYMLDKTEYNMYLDQFGFIRTYELAQGSNYALVTEMYNTNANAYNYINNNTWIAEVKMGDADLDEFVVANPGSAANGWNPFISTYAWTTRVSRYNNASDLNMLQPAIAHLGTTMVTSFAPFVGATTGVGPQYYLAGTGTWNRGVFEIAKADGTAAVAGDNIAVFDYGKQDYSAYTTAGGSITAGTANHTASFTNVAVYTMDGDNVVLNTAAQLSKDKDGTQLYRVGFNTILSPVTAANQTVDGSSVPGTANKSLTFGKVGTEAQLKQWWIEDNTNTTTGIVSDGVTTSASNKAADIIAAADAWWALNYSGSLTSDVNKDGTGIYPVYATDYVQLRADQDVTAGQRHFNINPNYSSLYNTLSNYYVNIVDDTEIYIATPTGTTHSVGFSSIPKINAKDIRAVYAVATNTAANSDGQDYWVAKVLVIETLGLAVSYDCVSLMYYNPWETTGSVRYVNSLNNRWSAFEAADPDIMIVPKTTINGGVYTWGSSSWDDDDYGFYALFDATNYNAEDDTLTAGDAQFIKENWSSYGIYAGTVRRLESIAGSGYIDVDRLGRTNVTLAQDDNNVVPLSYRNVPVYRISGRSAGTIRLTATNGDVSVGDRLIWVYAQGSTTNVAYIVDLDDQGNRYYTTPSYLERDYDLILDTQKPDASAGIVSFTGNYAGYLDGETIKDFPMPASIKVSDLILGTETSGSTTKMTLTINQSDMVIAGHKYVSTDLPDGYAFVSIGAPADAKYSVTTKSGSFGSGNWVLTVTGDPGYDLTKGIVLEMTFDYDETAPGAKPPIKAKATEGATGSSPALPAGDWKIEGLQPATGALTGPQRNGPSATDIEPGQPVDLYFLVRKTYNVTGVTVNAPASYDGKNISGEYTVHENEDGTASKFDEGNAVETGFVEYWITMTMPDTVIDLTINTSTTNVSVTVPEHTHLPDDFAGIAKDSTLAANSTIKFEPDTNYEVPAAVTVTMNGKPLTLTEDYTYEVGTGGDAGKGIVKFVAATKVTGPIVITGTATAEVVDLALDLIANSTGLAGANFTVTQDGKTITKNAGETKWVLTKGVEATITVAAPDGKEISAISGVDGSNDPNLTFTKVNGVWTATVDPSDNVSSKISVTYATVNLTLTFSNTNASVSVNDGSDHTITSGTALAVTKGTTVTITVAGKTGVSGVDYKVSAAPTAEGLTFAASTGAADTYVVTYEVTEAKAFTLNITTEPKAVTFELNAAITGVTLADNGKVSLTKQANGSYTGDLKVNVGTNASFTDNSGTKELAIVLKAIPDNFTVAEGTVPSGWTWDTTTKTLTATADGANLSEAAVATLTITYTAPQA